MKRKPLVESSEDKCICGHKRAEHYQELLKNKKFAAKEKETHGSYFNAEENSCCVGSDVKPRADYCFCDKYLDRRHCKIKKTDPILRYLKMRPGLWLDYDDFKQFTGCSMPTISRRCALFFMLDLVEKTYISSGTFGSFTNHKLNHNIYEKLVKEGIIVD